MGFGVLGERDGLGLFLASLAFVFGEYFLAWDL